MLTVDPFAASVHYNQVSDAARFVAAADTSNRPSGLLSAIAIAVVFMLMSFALKGLGGIVSALWGMTRMLFSALWAAALVVAALVVLLVAIVIPNVVR